MKREDALLLCRRLLAAHFMLLGFNFSIACAGLFPPDGTDLMITFQFWVTAILAVISWFFAATLIRDKFRCEFLLPTTPDSVSPNALCSGIVKVISLALLKWSVLWLVGIIAGYINIKTDSEFSDSSFPFTGPGLFVLLPGFILFLFFGIFFFKSHWIAKLIMKNSNKIVDSTPES